MLRLRSSDFAVFVETAGSCEGCLRSSSGVIRRATAMSLCVVFLEVCLTLSI